MSPETSITRTIPTPIQLKQLSSTSLPLCAHRCTLKCKDAQLHTNSLRYTLQSFQITTYCSHPIQSYLHPNNFAKLPKINQKAPQTTAAWTTSSSHPHKHPLNYHIWGDLIF